VRIRDPMAGGDPAVLATHSERYRKKAVDWLDMEIGGRSLMTAGSWSMDGGRRTIWLEAGGLLWLEARQENYFGWGSIAGSWLVILLRGCQKSMVKSPGGRRPRVVPGTRSLHKGVLLQLQLIHQFIKQRQQARVRQRRQKSMVKSPGGRRPRVVPVTCPLHKGILLQLLQIHQFIQQRQQARVRQRFQRLFRLGSRRMKLGRRRRRRRCAGRVYEVCRRERSHTRLRRA
jgi:hypothetical protein